MTNVLITGAARGIGYEMTKQYADADNRFFATTRNPASADQLNALAAGSDGLVSVHAMDVGDMASVQACAADLAGQPIDVLINNAGVFQPGAFLETSLESFNSSFSDDFL